MFIFVVLILNEKTFELYFKKLYLDFIYFLFFQLYFFKSLSRIIIYCYKLMAENDVQNAQELTEFVKGLLNQMNERFKTMTDSIVGR